MKKLNIMKIIFASVCFLFSITNNAQGVFRINGTNSAVQIGFDDYRFLTFGNGLLTPNNGAWSIEHWDGGLNFWKPWPSSSNWGNYKMFISDENANVGINMKPYTALSFLKLQVGGYVVANGYFTWSDAQLKKGIEEISEEEGLEKLMLLKPLSYEYDQSITLGSESPSSDVDETKNATIANDNQAGDGYLQRHFGFIAEDVANVFPNIVSQTNPENPEENDYNSVNYIELIPILVKSIQQQQRQIEESTLYGKKQEKKIKALENRNAEIEKQQKEIEELKTLVQKLLKDKN